MVKFKNRYSGLVIDMDVYEQMTIDEQWDYDLVEQSSWDYVDEQSERVLKASWTPSLDQDLESLTDPESPFYDPGLVEQILEKYESIEEFKGKLKTVQIKLDPSIESNVEIAQSGLFDPTSPNYDKTLADEIKTQAILEMLKNNKEN